MTTTPSTTPTTMKASDVRSDGHDAEVVIVGGGPVGMALAIDLGQRGISCIVVERYATPQPIPKGQNLTQRTMEHFRLWGAEAELRAARTIPTEYAPGGMTCYGTLLSGYNHDWFNRALVRPYYFTDNERLPQYATEAVLRRRAADVPNVTTLYGWTAESVAQDESGVRVTIAARDGEGRRALTAAYVVGCDGSRSLVREQAGITQTRSDHDRLMVLLVFRSEGLQRLLDAYPPKSIYKVLHPDLDGYWRFFGRVDGDATWFFHAPIPLDTKREGFDFRPVLFEAIGAEVDVDLRHVGFWDLRIAYADTYRAGRVFVAGDAAHSHPPYGGYGINTGFEDAANLAWKLAAVIEGWGGPHLLDSYDAERRPVFASTAHDFIEQGIREDRVFLAAFDPARDKAAFEAEWRGRQSGARSEIASFEPHYEGSPIVWGLPGACSGAVGSHGFVARAGHHLAPPADDEVGPAFFDGLADGFTLLADAEHKDVADAFAEAAREIGIPLRIARLASGDRYDAALVLVRPDQFVAWRASEPPVDPPQILARATGACPG